MKDCFSEIRTVNDRLWRRSQVIGAVPDSFEVPIGIQFELTYLCNLRCRHCYNESGLRNKDGFKEELSDEQWLQIAKEAVEWGIFSAVISGGEPFMRLPLLMELIAIFDAADVQVGLISNGWFINEANTCDIARFRKSIGWVQVSIDGTDSITHDRIRGVSGSFDRAVGAIINLLQHGFYVRLATALMPENLHQIEQFFELGVFLGVDGIHIGNVINMGAGRTIPIDHQSREETFAKLVKLQEMYSECLDVLISLEPWQSVELRRTWRNHGFLIRPNGELKLDCVIPVIFGKYERSGDIKRHWVLGGLKYAYEDPFVIEFMDRIITEQSYASIGDVHRHPQDQSVSTR